MAKTKKCGVWEEKAMKKILSVFISMLVFTASAYAGGFVDTENHWAQNTINRLAGKGIVNGTDATHFSPDAPIRRAEYLKMMMELVGIEKKKYRYGECLDAGASDWYAEYLQSALDRGLIPKEMITSYKVSITVNGNEMSVVYTGAFNGELPIDRAEMAVLSMNLYQYALDSSNAGTLPLPTGERLADIDDVSVWAQPSVRLAVAAGFIEGMDDGSFRPHENATRAQAATILGRILDKQK